ncbi:hypothetical protein UAW_03258 [Enterococcus haemoperoxidus ATCC BAA-382]|uniref:DUF2871 domain-containing protein n=1 Tax=Enterococcus haemoperoxidus ATCC BAA-382 TaxID=1158608 RepID=R2QAN2_9ENTE|nr:DUF2871 domain-containing protein [Enterococcus haemoperoxidus]EOH92273.1 hypothetical protein UAW_03258 [Enterococcus haemoperoxidus ATCC BAA-382]EOT61958.1 hypothetical protein I583_00941 [Enterococcus haemoperoxidus ATCC BAA-382]
MKKLVRVSMSYMIFGLLAGIFYREFTKWTGFTGETQLSVLHTHVLILGMFFFLIVLLLEKNFQLSKEKNYKKFYIIYNIGLGVTLLLMIVRGVLQVLDYPESAAISGIAGLGHIIITVGLAYFFQVLFKAVKE